MITCWHRLGRRFIKESRGMVEEERILHQVAWESPGQPGKHLWKEDTQSETRAVQTHEPREHHGEEDFR